MRCTQTVEAGAYVIGALSPPERYTYERHLATCAGCRYEVAQLAGLPGLLGRLDARTAVSVGTSAPGAPPRVLDGVLNRARAESLRGRRKRTWERVATLAVAACLALLVGFGVSTFISPSSPVPVAAGMTQVLQEPGITAAVAYWPDSNGGTKIAMTCTYPKTGDKDDQKVTLDMWLVPRNGGAAEKVDTWDAGPGFHDTWAMAAKMGMDQIDRMEVRRGNSVVLVYKMT